MKAIIVLVISSFFISFSSEPTVDTYNWEPYKKKSADMLEALSKVTEANVILFDNYDVDFDALPKRTKTQLVLLQEAAFLEWLVAEEALGNEEAAKYWTKGRSEKTSGNTCYYQWQKEYVNIMPQIYASIKSCKLETKTACHLNEIVKLVDLDVNFNNCLVEQSGKTLSPLTKN